MNKELCYALGIDTSNYTTSVAIVDSNGHIIADERILLDVPLGARGLRQSDAVFKHVMNLPVLLEKIFPQIDNERIKCVSVSTRPRPVDHSYMPVFLSGQSFSRSIAAAFKLERFEFSHQEGHIKAGCINQPIDSEKDFLALHLSGGTSELLTVKKQNGEYDIKIIGGTKDISIGQLIDRVGVKLGHAFPCGKVLDQLACDYDGEKTQYLKKIFTQDSYMNLSGIETQCMNLIDGDIQAPLLIWELFEKISIALNELIRFSTYKYKLNRVLLVGGVASSKFIKERLTDSLKEKNIYLSFADPYYSSDNAVGIAALGIDRLNRRKESLECG